VTLGQDILANQWVQYVVPAGTWQGSRLVWGGQYALLGTTVAPGFEPDDFSLGERETLKTGWPQEAGWIEQLSRG